MEIQTLLAGFITTMFAVWLIASAYKYNDIQENPEEYR